MPKQSNTSKAQPQDSPAPLTQLEGFRCPSILPIAILADSGDCPNPLDNTSMTGVSPVKTMIRMRNGTPNEHGPDVRVLRMDGTSFEICGAPITFSYKLDPIEIRLDNAEVRTLANQLWKMEQGENYPEAIALVRDGQVTLSPILTHRFSPERVGEAFALAERKDQGAVRVAITFP